LCSSVTSSRFTFLLITSGQASTTSKHIWSRHHTEEHCAHTPVTYANIWFTDTSHRFQQKVHF
jgi:hypothetical protein